MGLSTRLASIAGGQESVLKQAPVDLHRYAAMGGVILSTALVAAASATLAVRMALEFPIPLAVAVGLGWGLIIYNLDRSLVLHMIRQDSKWRNVGMAAPRVILAIILGTVISTPMVLQIFHSEIETELEVMHQEDQDAFRKALDSDKRFVGLPALEKRVAELTTIVDTGIDRSAVEKDATIVRLQKEVDELEPTVEAARTDFIDENSGEGGTGRPGQGSVWKEKKQRYDDLNGKLTAKQNELTAARNAATDRLRAQEEQVRATASTELAAKSEILNRLTEQKKLAEDAFRSDSQDYTGLLARLTALERLHSGQGLLLFAHIALFLVFFSIELLPVLIKLLQLLGPETVYEKLLKIEERDAISSRGRQSEEAETLDKSRREIARQLELDRAERALQAGKKNNEQVVETQAQMMSDLLKAWGDYARAQTAEDLRRWKENHPLQNGTPPDPAQDQPDPNDVKTASAGAAASAPTDPPTDPATEQADDTTEQTDGTVDEVDPKADPVDRTSAQVGDTNRWVSTTSHQPPPNRPEDPPTAPAYGGKHRTTATANGSNPSTPAPDSSASAASAPDSSEPAGSVPDSSASASSSGQPAENPRTAPADAASGDGLVPETAGISGGGTGVPSGNGESAESPPTSPTNGGEHRTTATANGSSPSAPAPESSAASASDSSAPTSSSGEPAEGPVTQPAGTASGHGFVPETAGVSGNGGAATPSAAEAEAAKQVQGDGAGVSAGNGESADGPPTAPVNGGEHRTTTAANGSNPSTPAPDSSASAASMSDSSAPASSSGEPAEGPVTQPAGTASGHGFVPETAGVSGNGAAGSSPSAGEVLGDGERTEDQPVVAADDDTTRPRVEPESDPINAGVRYSLLPRPISITTTTARRKPAAGSMVGGRWIIQGTLRGGGHGQVYRATDSRESEADRGNYAVKVTRDQKVHTRDSAVRPEHENIGEIRDWGEDKDYGYFLVSPLYEPGDLYVVRERETRRRSIGWALDLVDQILDGLAAFNNKVHLDIKPNNLVLDGEIPRIIDWGLARPWERKDPRATLPADRFTPFFTSPQQWDGNHVDTPFDDLFSVGGVLYWLISGEEPFRRDLGDGMNPHGDYVVRVLDESPPARLDELIPGIPAPLAELANRWLAFKPEDRLPRKFGRSPNRQVIRSARKDLANVRSKIEGHLDTIVWPKHLGASAEREEPQSGGDL